MIRDLPKVGNAIARAAGRCDEFWWRWFSDLRDVVVASELGLGANTQSPSYVDLELPIASMLDDAGLSVRTFSGNTKGLMFPASTDNHVAFSIALPRNYVAGSSITPFVRWSPDNTDTGVAVFECEYQALAAGTAVGSGTSITSNGQGTGTQYELIRTDFSSVSGSGRVGGDLFIGAVGRLGSDSGDTYNDDVIIHSFGLRYQAKNVGAGL